MKRLHKPKSFSVFFLMLLGLSSYAFLCPWISTTFAQSQRYVTTTNDVSTDWEAKNVPPVRGSVKTPVHLIPYKEDGQSTLKKKQVGEYQTAEYRSESQTSRSRSRTNPIRLAQGGESAAHDPFTTGPAAAGIPAVQAKETLLPETQAPAFETELPDTAPPVEMGGPELNPEPVFEPTLSDQIPQTPTLESTEQGFMDHNVGPNSHSAEQLPLPQGTESNELDNLLGQPLPVKTNETAVGKKSTLPPISTSETISGKTTMSLHDSVTTAPDSGSTGSSTSLGKKYDLPEKVDLSQSLDPSTVEHPELIEAIKKDRSFDPPPISREKGSATDESSKLPPGGWQPKGATAPKVRPAQPSVQTKPIEQPTQPTKIIPSPKMTPKQGTSTQTKPKPQLQPQTKPQFAQPGKNTRIIQEEQEPLTESVPESKLPATPYDLRRGTKRCDRECVIGPQFPFPDQFGDFGECAPFCGLFVENPNAPIFQPDMCGGNGTDFFGYQNDRCAARPCAWLFDNMTLFVGGVGFGNHTGPIDEKSFGISEGVNWAGRISPRFGISAQLGVRTIQRTIDGNHPSMSPSDWDSSGKGQVFVTAGLFKRSTHNPFQYGFVYDWMSDTKYETETNKRKFNLGQVRTEFSYLTCRGCSLGVRGVFGTNDTDPFDNATYKIRSATQILGFAEIPFACGGIFGINAGGSSEGNAIIGVGFDQPFYDKFSVKTDFAYMIPKSGKDTSGKFATDDQQGWEASITFVFHPHGGAFTRGRNPQRAMFDVAGNGSLFSVLKKD